MLRHERHLVEKDTVRREPLGTQRIEGVEAVGQRTVVTIPALAQRNDNSIELVDEQWESPELRLIVYALYSDSLGGQIEYRLTTIRRADPPPDLFVVPSDYTLDAKRYGFDDPWYASQDGRWALNPGRSESSAARNRTLVSRPETNREALATSEER